MPKQDAVVYLGVDKLTVAERARVLNIVWNVKREFDFINTPYPPTRVGQLLREIQDRAILLESLLLPDGVESSNFHWQNAVARSCRLCGSICEVSAYKMTQETTDKAIKDEEAFKRILHPEKQVA